MLAEAGIQLTIDGQDRAARQAVQNDPTAWDIAEYSDAVVDFTTSFWNDLFGAEANGGLTQGFTDDATLQELLQAAIADRSEENMNAFKEAFGKNYELASRKFSTAIEEIDKSIDHLNKIKDALTSSDRQLRLANDKAQDLTVRKLTKNAPSIAEKMKG